MGQLALHYYTEGTVLNEGEEHSILWYIDSPIYFQWSWCNIVSSEFTVDLC